MVEVLTESRAKAFGERELANHLSSLDDARLRLLFTLDFIPGMRESDILLIHDSIGVFIIEAKTFDINAITSVSPTEWIIKGRSEKESPILQAYRQYEGFRDYFRPIYGRLPFICTTVLFSRISRNDFKRRFKSSIYVDTILDRLIFSEDLFSGVQVLRRRLEEIIQNPPARQGSPPYRVHDRFLDTIRSVLDRKAPNVPTVSERDRLKTLERGITQEMQQEYPPGVRRVGIFVGHPGTGKTFRLLSIGCFHAYEGQQVLFTCFNKTLASDIRRLISFNDKLRISTGNVEVLDVNQLALRCFDINGIGYRELEDADEWGEMLVEEIHDNKNSTIRKFDVVLIDEIQDMKEWQLELVALHMRDDTTIAVALGKGQELYRNPAAAELWLSKMEQNRNPKRYVLRRNFRNPRDQFLVAKAFYDCWPDKYYQLTGIFNERSNKKKQADITFDRSEGEQPRYLTLAVSNKEFEDSGQFQDEIVAETFSFVLEEAFRRLDDDPNLDPVGLLILVPEAEGLHCRVARIALTKACTERNISFIDYTQENSRRASPRQDEVRLCTFHSARGLEGDHVVLFGLERIEHLTDKTDAPTENIAFVALSRAVFSTTVVCRANPRTRVHDLCEKIWQTMNS